MNAINLYLFLTNFGKYLPYIVIHITCQILGTTLSKDQTSMFSLDECLSLKGLSCPYVILILFMIVRVHVRKYFPGKINKLNHPMKSY